MSPVAPGDHVVTLFSPQCRECEHCRDPRTNLCLAIREQQNLGYLPDGTTRLSRDGEPVRHFMGTSTFAATRHHGVHTKHGAERPSQRWRTAWLSQSHSPSGPLYMPIAWYPLST